MFLVRQFEEEANEHFHSPMQEFTKCITPTQSDSSWSEFRRWMNYRSWDLKELNYEVVEERFHDKLIGVIEPLVEMFTLKPPPTHKVEVVVEEDAKAEV